MLIRITQIGISVHPIVVGGGKRFLSDGVRVNLELVDERCFGGGVVHLRNGARI